MSEKITSWQDMKVFGFDLLTGEACGIGIRGLFDVTDEAKKTLYGFFGLTSLDGFADAWNSRDGATGSILLPYSLLHPLATYCLLVQKKWPLVLTVSHRAKSYTSDFVMGLTDKDWLEMANRADHLWPKSYNLYYNHATSNEGRNVHHFTGRMR